MPRARKQGLVGEVFSSVAPSYDVMNDLMSGGLHRLWKDRLVEKLRPWAGMRHLDVAGGTGDVAFRVLDAMRREAAAVRGVPRAAATPSPPGSEQQQQEKQQQELGGVNSSSSSSEGEGVVTVFDINAEMLAEGQRKAAARGVPPHAVAWVEGNAEALPFPDASMDSYTVAFGIRNVTDRDAALREAHRVLRPGGRFLCLEFSRLAVPQLQPLYDLYSFNVIPEIGRRARAWGARMGARAGALLACWFALQRRRAVCAGSARVPHHTPLPLHPPTPPTHPAGWWRATPSRTATWWSRSACSPTRRPGRGRWRAQASAGWITKTSQPAWWQYTRGSRCKAECVCALACEGETRGPWASAKREARQNAGSSRNPPHASAAPTSPAPPSPATSALTRGIISSSRAASSSPAPSPDCWGAWEGGGGKPGGCQP